MTVVDIARIAHEVNKAYCESIGDKSQPTWEAAPEWQRNSAIDGVHFHLQNPDAGPEASHQNWLDLKIKEGWKEGSIKDPATKTHPCCVPFNRLPKEQQTKDFLFRQVVHSLKELI
jgi:hypothetical protein